MDPLDPKVTTAIIAAATGLAGTIIGAYSKSISSKQKIREINESYNHKIQENYLEKAREYTNSVYVPLSISLSSLGYEFQKFRANRINQDAKLDFSNSITQFLSSVADLSSKGANAFLTAELDELLQSFCSFLSESKSAKVPTLKMVIGYSLPLFGSGYSEEVERRISGNLARKFWSQRISVSLGGIGLSYEAKEILSAPLESSDFEERFVKNYHTINVLIKEVTLGSKAKHSIQGAGR